MRIQNNAAAIVDAVESLEELKINAITHAIGHAMSSPIGIHTASDTVRLLDFVSGRYPLARCATNAMTTAKTMNPSPPRQTRISSAYAQSGGVANLNFFHVSAGRPVIAQIGGKSLAHSWEAQIWTLPKAQTQELVQAAVEARLGRDLADREQHARDVGLAAGRPVHDRQRLSWKPEDDLMVGDEAGKAHAVHGDVPLLPTSRSGQGLLLSFLVAERLVTPQRGEPFRGRQGRSGRSVQLGRVVHLDHLDGIEMRGGYVSQVHHQHGADREVRCDDAADPLALAGGLELVDGVRAQARGTDHRRGA